MVLVEQNTRLDTGVYKVLRMVLIAKRCPLSKSQGGGELTTIRSVGPTTY